MEETRSGNAAAATGANGGDAVSLKAACCACLTELVVNDANGQQTVHNNGIYLLALLLVQPITDRRCQHVTPHPDTVHLQVPPA